VKLKDCVIVEMVFDKLWEAEAFSESDSGLVYLDVHDAVLAAVERDDTLHQQVSTVVVVIVVVVVVVVVVVAAYSLSCHKIIALEGANGHRL